MCTKTIIYVHTKDAQGGHIGCSEWNSSVKAATTLAFTGILELFRDMCVVREVNQPGIYRTSRLVFI